MLFRKQTDPNESAEGRSVFGEDTWLGGRRSWWLVAFYLEHNSQLIVLL